MPVINFKRLKTEVPARNFDTKTLTDDYDIALQDASGVYGVKSFFGGIRDFFKGVAALGTLTATSRITVTDSNGNVTYTTPNAIKNTLSLATTTDLDKIETVEDIYGTEGVEYDVDNFTSTGYKIRYGRFYNNTNDYANYHLACKGWNIIQWVPLTTNATYGYQVSYTPVSTTPQYKRYKSNGVWGEWIKITTETDVNNALENYPRVDQYIELNNGEKCEIKTLQAFRYWILYVARSTSSYNKFCLVALHQIVTLIENNNVIIEEVSGGVINVTNNTGSQVRVSLFPLGLPYNITITKITN